MKKNFTKSKTATGKLQLKRPTTTQRERVNKPLKNISPNRPAQKSQSKQKSKDHKDVQKNNKNVPPKKDKTLANIKEISLQNKNEQEKDQ